MIAAPAFAGALMVAACGDSGRDGQPSPTPEEAAQPPEVEQPPVSIFRPEVAPAPAEPAPPPPYDAVIGFPEGGYALDAAAVEDLGKALESPQLAAGWPIVLRGHSDSAGSDETNLRVSERRAEAVAAWLAEQGVDETRISIVPLGEQNPAEPNAKPDGSPNEAGRARNRRVEISIAPPSAEPEADAEQDVSPAADDAA